MLSKDRSSFSLGDRKKGMKKKLTNSKLDGSTTEP